jgi:hypothetical protein
MAQQAHLDLLGLRVRREPIPPYRGLPGLPEPKGLLVLLALPEPQGQIQS